MFLVFFLKIADVKARLVVSLNSKFILIFHPQKGKRVRKILANLTVKIEINLMQMVEETKIIREKHIHKNTV